MTSASEKINLTFFFEHTPSLRKYSCALQSQRSNDDSWCDKFDLWDCFRQAPNRVDYTAAAFTAEYADKAARCGWEELLRWEFLTSEAIRRMWTLSIRMCALPALQLEYFTDMHRASLLMDHLSWHNGAHIVKRQKCWWFFFFFSFAF